MRLVRPTLVCIALLSLYASVNMVSAQANQTTIPVLTNSVTLDGKWTSPSEWSDAVELAGDMGVSHFRMKHDGDHLYVLGDHVSDPSLSSGSGAQRDVAWVYIDSMMNGGTSPQPDDYAFSIQWVTNTQSALVVQKGTGSDWSNLGVHVSFSAASSSDASNDPYTSSAHLIYEFQIPKSLLPQGATSIGLRLAMHDGGTNVWTVWPQQAATARTNPNLWAQANLSTTPIPEYQSVFSILSLALAASLYSLKRKRLTARSRTTSFPKSSQHLTLA